MDERKRIIDSKLSAWCEEQGYLQSVASPLSFIFIAYLRRKQGKNSGMT